MKPKDLFAVILFSASLLMLISAIGFRIQANKTLRDIIEMDSSLRDLVILLDSVSVSRNRMADNKDSLYSGVYFRNNIIIDNTPDTLEFGEGKPNTYYNTKGNEVIKIDGKIIQK